MLQAFDTVISQIEQPVTVDVLESLERIAGWLRACAINEMCLALLHASGDNHEEAERYEAMCDEHISLLTSISSYLELEYRKAATLH
jgi:hypothetical protein